MAFRSSLDRWADALGIGGGSQRSRVDRVLETVQPTAEIEWNAGLLAEPSNDSLIAYATARGVGLAAARPACVLTQAAAAANLDGRMRPCWWWYRVSSVDAGGAQVTAMLRDKSAFQFNSVGAASVNHFNPEVGIAQPRSRSLFKGSTTTAFDVQAGLTTTHTPGVGSEGGFGLWHGPYFCPASLDVCFIGDTVGILNGITIQMVWRELPSRR